MIRLKQLAFCYPNQSLSHQPSMLFDVEIPRGQIVAVMGPSGAGKSTLLDLIAGFNLAHSGELRLDGKLATDLSPSQRPITQLFQEHNLFIHLSVFHNLALGLRPDCRLTPQQHAALVKAAEQVGVADYLQRSPDALSGGQRQRVALARCLLRQQPILLLDEPFSALDPSLREEMLGLVKQIANEHSLTVLMVSHQPSDAEKIANRVLTIDNGRIQTDQSL